MHSGVVFSLLTSILSVNRLYRSVSIIKDQSQIFSLAQESISCALEQMQTSPKIKNCKQLELK